jgi:hypothetical protein
MEKGKSHKAYEFAGLQQMSEALEKVYKAPQGLLLESQSSTSTSTRRLQFTAFVPHMYYVGQGAYQIGPTHTEGPRPRAPST